jgi:hypothetical protein
MMKVIDQRADRRAAQPRYDRRERIRQRGLARAIDAIDADADDPFRMQTGNQDREAAQQGCVRLAHVNLSMRYDQRGSRLCGAPSRDAAIPLKQGQPVELDERHYQRPESRIGLRDDFQDHGVPNAFRRIDEVDQQRRHDRWNIRPHRFAKIRGRRPFV